MPRTAIYSLFILSASLVANTSTPAVSPAEISIRKAQQDIARQPEHYPYYNALAMAYARRARETSDVAWYGKAEETLQRSFAISPDNYEGLKVKTWLLLGRHEFAKALVVAKDLNQRTPDDVTVYGYLADANAELGNYADAVAAAQWMLDLRPGNVAGLTRAAYLRELHGDLPGALELMQMAYDATPYQEFEDRAWLLTQRAHLHLIAGNLDQAETFARGALELFPNYHYALGTLGQICMAQAKFKEAAEFFEKRYATAPHAENLYALAERWNAPDAIAKPMRPSPFSSKRRSPSPRSPTTPTTSSSPITPTTPNNPPRHCISPSRNSRAGTTSSPSMPTPGLWRHPATTPRPDPRSVALWPSVSKIPSCSTTPASSRLGSTKRNC